MGSFASVNGTVVPADQARVSVLDNGFAFGDSVYETLRTYAGRPFHLDRHIARLRRSAARLAFDIPLSDQELARRLDAVLAAAANSESYIRFIVSRGVGDISYHFERIQGPTVVMFVKPYERYPDEAYAQGIPVALVSVRRNNPLALDPAIKSCNLLNNILATQEAQALGAVEALLLNDHGELAEGAASNLFIVKDGLLITPPLSAGILEGVTRDVLLELAPALGIPAVERPVSVAALLGADEAFITSTLKEAAPIRTINGKPVGNGRPGTVTLRLLAAFRAYAPRHCS
jgi:branched-chain amino acid aminotransferase